MNPEEEKEKGQVNVSHLTTVKPFNLAAKKVGEFACRFILVLFILENPNYAVPTLE